MFSPTYQSLLQATSLGCPVSPHLEEEEGDIDEPEVEEKDDEKGEEGDEQGENEEEIDRPLPSRILVDF